MAEVNILLEGYSQESNNRIEARGTVSLILSGENNLTAATGIYS